MTPQSFFSPPDVRDMPRSWVSVVSERKRKPSTSARGYGVVHRGVRKRWAPLVASGNVLCARCGLRISPGELWDLGHDDLHRVAVNGGAVGRHPEHRRCNRGTVLHSRPVTVAPREVPPDDPANHRWYGPNGEVWSRPWCDWR